MKVLPAPQNQQRRLVLQMVGKDFPQCLHEQVALHVNNKEEVCYLDVPLSDPACALAVDVARAAGFFFGALLIERGGGDSIRLQRYSETLAAPQHMVLASSEAKALMAFVMEDQVSVTNA